MGQEAMERGAGRESGNYRCAEGRRRCASSEVRTGRRGVRVRGGAFQLGGGVCVPGVGEIPGGPLLRSR